MVGPRFCFGFAHNKHLSVLLRLYILMCQLSIWGAKPTAILLFSLKCQADKFAATEYENVANSCDSTTTTTIHNKRIRQVRYKWYFGFSFKIKMHFWYKWNETNFYRNNWLFNKIEKTESHGVHYARMNIFSDRYKPIHVISTPFFFHIGENHNEKCTVL